MDLDADACFRATRARDARFDGRFFVGIMVESHLVGGRQDLVPGKPLVYGQSITDACLGWDDSVALLERLASGVRGRRLHAANASGK
jgi:3-deoxy-7-phosphoheptulonate synthase